MEKDATVLELLDRLRSVLDFDLVEIVDYWDADLCAIGLKTGNRLVYINTFNSDATYDYYLELLDPHNKESYNVINKGRGVSETVLTSVIKEYLFN